MIHCLLELCDNSFYRFFSRHSKGGQFSVPYFFNVQSILRHSAVVTKVSTYIKLFVAIENLSLAQTFVQKSKNIPFRVYYIISALYFHTTHKMLFVVY